MTISREKLAAFADGQLDDDERARIEQAIAADPSLAREVSAHQALRDRLNAHYAPILEQVPAHLTALLEPSQAPESDATSNITSFAEARAKRGMVPAVRRWAPIAGPALAASLVLTIWQPWQGSGPPEGYADATLSAALDTQLVASQERDAEPRILLSFEADEGELCRAFSGEARSGIACRDDTGWRIEQILGGGTAQSTEFRQASSEQDLYAAAQELAIGGALDPQAETAARKRGWRASR